MGSKPLNGWLINFLGIQLEYFIFNFVSLSSKYTFCHGFGSFHPLSRGFASNTSKILKVRANGTSRFSDVAITLFFSYKHMENKHIEPLDLEKLSTYEK